MKKGLLSVALAAGLLVSAIGAQAATTIYGLTSSNAIFKMSDAGNPSSISGPYSISGIASGQTLVALDSRPGSGTLYALGYNSTSGEVQLYTITGSGSSWSASAVGSSTTSISLGTAASVGFDFISTMANEIRITSTSGSSYVMNADNGTIMSTGSSAISYASGDISSGLTATIGATAYTNSFLGADAANEIGYDLNNNLLVMFDAATYSDGYDYTPTTIHTMGVSGLLLSSGSSVGMDSYYDTMAHNNTTYISATSAISSGAHLYTINSLGYATDLGAIGDGTLNVRDIATQQQNMSSSTISGTVMAGLTLNLRNIVFFDSYNPGNVRNMIKLSGITSGQSMVAITFGANGNLYGLGYNSTSQMYQLYLIDTVTGSVSAINSTAASLHLGTDDGSGNYINVAFGFIATDSNRIRVIGNDGSTNVQLSATTGLVVATDSTLSYASGDVHYGSTVNVGSMAYTNNYMGATSSEMVGFDFNTGAVFTGNGGGSASLSTLIDLGTILDLFSSSGAYNNGYLDIMYNESTGVNTGYIGSDYYGDSSYTDNFGSLYVMTGTDFSSSGKGTAVGATRIGNIGGGIPVKDIAVSRVPHTTAITNVSGNTSESLLAYPNPTTSIARIVLTDVSAGTVYADIYDMNGRIMRSYEYPIGSYQLDVDMSPLPTGLYSVRISQPNQPAQNVKILKQ